jgi:hypothetical protein
MHTVRCLRRNPEPHGARAGLRQRRIGHQREEDSVVPSAKAEQRPWFINGLLTALLLGGLIPRLLPGGKAAL